MYRYTKDRGVLWTTLYSFRWITIQIRYKYVRLKSYIHRLKTSTIRIWKHKEGMETVTYPEFVILQEKDPYYNGRWEYFKEVIDIIKKDQPQSVLELGANTFPIVKESDSMDKNPWLPRLTYHHDANTFPWPIKDSKYDLFIALQVWEHLGSKQKEAFKEVMRISRRAILSFPYKWNCPGDIHHNIDERRIAEWTLHVKPEEIRRTGKRIIYLFNFIT